MAAIDVGPGATDRDGSMTYGYTALTLGNPANDTGILTSVEFWANSSMSSVKVGTFYGSSTTWTNRDGATIGSVTAGSKQTFSGLSIDVSTSDVIGTYWSAGTLDRDAANTDGRVYKTGDYFGAGTVSGYTANGESLSLYGTGATAAVGWTGKIWGVTNPAKIWGIPVANISKVGGI